MVENNIKKLSELCINAFKSKGMSIPDPSESKQRLLEELTFFKNHPSLVDSALGFYSSDKKGGNINKPNSIIFYLLEVTNAFPDLNKNFEFMFEVDKENSRISPPDIDIDFEHRESILQHICDLYGKEKVALIGTAIGYKPKAAIQFAAKALDITETQTPEDRRFSSENDQEAKRISKIIPNVPGITLKQWMGDDEDFTPPSKKIEEVLKEVEIEKKKYPKVFDHASKLEGIIKSYGTHAAGVVVSIRDIVEDVPLHVAKVVQDEDSLDYDSSEILNLMTTQYDMEDVEDLGLLKFDFLQVDTLRQIRLALNLIKEFHGEDIDIENLDTNDPNVFKTIDEGKLEGLFQISGKAFAGSKYPVYENWETKDKIKTDKNGNEMFRRTKGVIATIGCKDFRDVVAPNALGRPGPLNCGMPQKYSDGKKNPKSIKYSHPLLKPILHETYGELIYQEQLIDMAKALAGWSFAKADNLRKACGKKKKEILDKIKPDFFEGCKKNGISETVAKKMWNISVEFGKYAFNKSHSTAYGLITYKTAYLKTYYPAEFMCAVLTSAAKKDEEKLKEVIGNFKEEYGKLKITNPDINKSKKTYVPCGEKKMEIIPPFISLKGIGSRASDFLVENQPFKNIDDFFVKLDRSIIDSKTLHTLQQRGVLNSLASGEELDREIKRYKNVIENNKSAKRKTKVEGKRSGLGF